MLVDGRIEFPDTGQGIEVWYRLAQRDDTDIDSDGTVEAEDNDLWINVPTVSTLILTKNGEYVAKGIRLGCYGRTNNTGPSVHVDTVQVNYVNGSENNYQEPPWN